MQKCWQRVGPCSRSGFFEPWSVTIWRNFVNSSQRWFTCCRLWKSSSSVLRSWQCVSRCLTNKSLSKDEDLCDLQRGGGAFLSSFVPGTKICLLIVWSVESLKKNVTRLSPTWITKLCQKKIAGHSPLWDNSWSASWQRGESDWTISLCSFCWQRHLIGRNKTKWRTRWPVWTFCSVWIGRPRLSWIPNIQSSITRNCHSASGGMGVKWQGKVAVITEISRLATATLCADDSALFLGTDKNDEQCCDLDKKNNIKTRWSKAGKKCKNKVDR